MPNSPHLTDEELALLNELSHVDSDKEMLTLPLVMDASIGPLLEQATGLELKLALGDIKLSFPVTLNHPVTSQEQVPLSSPHIMSNDEHPRAWRFPYPKNIKLTHPSGQPLATEIRDLSIHGMRLLSRCALFSADQTHKKAILQLESKQQLPLRLTLVRQHQGPQFWLTTVTFKLNIADRATLSDFVFSGLLAQIKK